MSLQFAHRDFTARLSAGRTLLPSEVKLDSTDTASAAGRHGLSHGQTLCLRDRSVGTGCAQVRDVCEQQGEGCTLLLSLSGGDWGKKTVTLV